MNTFQLVSTVILATAIVPVNLFPVVYSFLAPWWRTHEGRHLMTMTAAIALVLDTTLLFRLTGVRLEWLFLIGYAGISFALWDRFFLLLHRQLFARKPDEFTAPVAEAPRRNVDRVRAAAQRLRERLRD